MIISSKKDKVLPSTLYETNISLILKKNKDETDPASYRPIALQNFDRKVITKALAIRLNKHLPSIIHPDQTGFIPARFSFSNVRRLLNTIYANHTKANGAAILSFDAQKAFDQVEWPYMFASLQRFGFGEAFISWVRLIHTRPICSVLTTADESPRFSKHRSEQQGCPLSPALEPLALNIRRLTGSVGLEVGDRKLVLVCMLKI